MKDSAPAARPAVAVLGATSHIARALIGRWAAEGEVDLTLFARRPLSAELRAAAPGAREVVGFDGPEAEESFDLIVNCVGAGSPGSPGFDRANWFTVLEEFDRRALAMLRRNPAGLLLSFSSGAIYGRHADFPAAADTVNRVAVNHVPVEEYYGIVRLFLETRHRALGHLNIVDLRIFAYFSRYADPGAGYLATDILRALREGRELAVSPDEAVRDYIDPGDLFRLVEACRLHAAGLNRAIDVRSAAPVGKFELLTRCRERFGLRFSVRGGGAASPNGSCSRYSSEWRQPDVESWWSPRFSAREAVENELAAALGDGE